MLSESDRKHYEELLMEEREEALEALREFDATRDQSLQDEMGELSVYRMHPADIATETMEREKKFLLASAEGERLYTIDEALRRLINEPENYGVCQSCGSEIQKKRLEVVPETQLCAACQAASED